MNSRIKNFCEYNHSIIKKKKEKQHDKIVLFAKTKLNTIEIVISRTLIDSYTSRVLVNGVLKEYNNMKEVLRNAKSINPENR